jgi:hypothetical protein
MRADFTVALEDGRVMNSRHRGEHSTVEERPIPVEGDVAGIDCALSENSGLWA